MITLLFLLQIKHWFADFWIQTYAQTVHKGTYGHPVGVSHTLDHVNGTLIALIIASVIMPISWQIIVICALIDFVIHYHVDWLKVKYGTKDNRTPRYWREFGLDQLAHQLTYILIIYLCLSNM